MMQSGWRGSVVEQGECRRSNAGVGAGGGLIDKRIAGGGGGATTMAGAADQRLRRRLRTGSEVQAGGTKGAARPKTATSACSQTAEAGGGTAAQRRVSAESCRRCRIRLDARTASLGCGRWWWYQSPFGAEVACAATRRCRLAAQRRDETRR